MLGEGKVLLFIELMLLPVISAMILGTYSSKLHGVEHGDDGCAHLV